MNLAVGISGLAQPLPEGLGFVELKLGLHGRSKGLQGQRAKLPPGVSVVLRAGDDVTFPRKGAPGTGHFRSSEEVRSSWQRTLAAVTALEAVGVVFRTPASFTPTDQHRDALVLHVQRLHQACPTAAFIWEPRGLWEQEDLQALALQTGLVAAVDPLAVSVPRGPLAFCRLGATQVERGGYGEADLLDVLDSLAGTERSWVLFEGSSASRNARTMIELQDLELDHG